MGNPVSDKNIQMLMGQDEIKVLLIHSGKVDIYLATVEKIVKK